MDLEELGYNYRRKRSDTNLKTTDITSGVAAQALLAVWRQKPHQAKFFSREHFGKLYDLIFTEELNGTQVAIAVLLYRIAENRRKRPDINDPEFVRYASCFIAMQMGRRLLKAMNLQLKDLNYQKFQDAYQLIEENGRYFFKTSIKDVTKALKKLYGEQEISLQQLSATFRRGDLIEKLNNLEI